MTLTELCKRDPEITAAVDAAIEQLRAPRHGGSDDDICPECRERPCACDALPAADLCGDLDWAQRSPVGAADLGDRLVLVTAGVCALAVAVLALTGALA